MQSKSCLNCKINSPKLKACAPLEWTETATSTTVNMAANMIGTVSLIDEIRPPPQIIKQHLPTFLKHSKNE